MKNKLIFLILQLVVISYLASAYAYEGSLGILQEEMFEGKEKSFYPEKSPSYHLLFFGNILSKQDLTHLSFQERVSGRASYSPLYFSPVFSRELDAPSSLVSREFFDLSWKPASDLKEMQKRRQELTLSEASMKWDLNKFRLEAGRFVMNYGQGEFFNPINPFNIPNGMLIMKDLPQSVDGGSLSYFPLEESDRLSLKVSLLADRFQNSMKKKEYTSWGMMDWQVFKDFSLTLLGGRDENQRKFGASGNFNFADALFFMEYMNTETYGQEDFLLGTDYQMSELWHFHSEFLYERAKKMETLQAYTLASSLNYQIHPLLKLHSIFLIDMENIFSYLILKAQWSYSDNVELTFYGQGPVHLNSKKEKNHQKIRPNILGLMGQFYF